MRAGPHPPAGPELETLVVAQRARVAGLGRVRELVLAAQDGLFLCLAVVTGLASANVGTTATVVAGLVEAVAGGLSEATEASLAARASDELYDAEVSNELAEIRAHRAVEIDELSILLQREGLAPGDAAAAARRIATSAPSLAKTKVEKELGLVYRADAAPWHESLVAGFVYALGALLALWPYLVWNPSRALVLSLASAGVTVAALAVVKARVAHVRLARNAVEAALCAAAAGAGYLLGRVGDMWIR